MTKLSVYRQHVLVSFLILSLVYSDVYARLEIIAETKSDSLPGKPIQYGANASGFSLGLGVGSALLVIVNNVLAFNGIVEDAYGLYAVGIVAGVAAIISGISGLAMRSKTIKNMPPGFDKSRLQKVKRKSITGIIFGLLGAVFSILLILAQYGTIGFV